MHLVLFEFSVLKVNCLTRMCFSFSKLKQHWKRDIFSFPGAHMYQVYARRCHTPFVELSLSCIK